MLRKRSGINWDIDVGYALAYPTFFVVCGVTYQRIRAGDLVKIENIKKKHYIRTE